MKNIEDLEACLEDARTVCISHSMRGASSRSSYHVEHTYFIDQADAWRAQMRRDFAGRGRQWFGAWRDERLIAYMVTLQVDNTMIIEKMKLHAEFMKYCPSDALYFRALEHAARHKSCLRIFNSTPQRPGLDRFKEQFLFKPTSIPIFVSNLRLYRMAMRAIALREQWMKASRVRREHTADKSQNRDES